MNQIHDLELAEIVFALKYWHHYPYIIHIDKLTCRKSLQYMFSQTYLNPKQRRWLELLKDYDMSVLCHIGKANVMADTLSKMSMGNIAHVDGEKRDLVKDVH